MQAHSPISQVRFFDRTLLSDDAHISTASETLGMFVTTPIYQISEKAADVMLSFAKTNSWTPSA